MSGTSYVRVGGSSRLCVDATPSGFDSSAALTDFSLDSTAGVGLPEPQLAGVALVGVFRGSRRPAFECPK